MAMGVPTGCGCKELKVYNYIDFLILLIPTPLVRFFSAASLLSVHFLMIFVLVPVLFCNYILCIKKFFRPV